MGVFQRNQIEGSDPAGFHWEQIFYGEFDGRRRKRVVVKVIGE